MVTCPVKARNTSSISCWCQTNSPLALTSLNCQPFDSAMILGDQCSVKRPNFCAMSTAPRPAPVGTASECSVMIVSLSDEGSGDFADANFRPPYKPKTKAPRTPSREGRQGLGCI